MRVEASNMSTVDTMLVARWPVGLLTVMYSTVHYSTVQHSTVQYSIQFLKVMYLILTLQVHLTLPSVFFKTDSVFFSKKTPRSVY